MISTNLTCLLEELSTLATELTDRTYQFCFQYLDTTKQLSIQFDSPDFKKTQVRLISVKKTQSFLNHILKLQSQEDQSKALVSFFNQNKVGNVTTWNRWLTPELNLKILTPILNEPIWNVYHIQAKLKNNQQLFFNVIQQEGGKLKSYALSKKDTTLLLSDLYQQPSFEKQISTFQAFCKKTPSLKLMNLQKGQTPHSENLSLLNEVLSLYFKRGYRHLLATQKSNGQLVLEVQPNTEKKVAKIPIRLNEGKTLLKTLSSLSPLEERKMTLINFFKSCHSTKNNPTIKRLLSQITMNEVSEASRVATKELLQQKHQEVEVAYLNPLKTLLKAPDLDLPFIHHLWETQLASITKGLPNLTNLQVEFKIKQEQKNQIIRLSTALYSVSLSMDNNPPTLQPSQLVAQIKNTYEGLFHYFPLLCAASQAQSFIKRLNQVFLIQAKQQMAQRHYKSLYPFEEVIEHLNHPVIDFERQTLQFDSDRACPLLDLEAISEQLKTCHQHILHDFEKVYQATSHCQTTLDPLTYFLLDVIRDLPNQPLATYLDILKGHSLQHQKVDAFNSFRRFTRRNILLRYQEAIQQQLLKDVDGIFSLTTKGQHLLNLTPQPCVMNLLHYEDVKSLTHFIERLQNGETADTLLLRLRRVSTVQAEELPLLLSFLQEDPELYRSKKDKLIDVLVEILPSTYQPFLELNSLLMTGPAQEVLIAIVQQMSSPTLNSSGGYSIESYS